MLVVVVVVVVVLVVLVVLVVAVAVVLVVLCGQPFPLFRQQALAASNTNASLVVVAGAESPVSGMLGGRGESPQPWPRIATWLFGDVGPKTGVVDLSHLSALRLPHTPRLLAVL